MSETLRIGAIVEGPTDTIVLEAALSNLLDKQSFVLTQLQPETSAAFGPTGAGWAGVYHWCRQTAAQGNGSLRRSLLFKVQDVLILHLDGDVADETYKAGNVSESTQDLPCAQPCPPACATTDALRQVLLRWVGETAVPPRTVLCTPSKSTEAWVLAALYPGDRLVSSAALECHPDPARRLQAKPRGERLVRAGRKLQVRYRERKDDITAAWPKVREMCTEAERFSRDFLAELPQH